MKVQLKGSDDYVEVDTYRWSQKHVTTGKKASDIRRDVRNYVTSSDRLGELIDAGIITLLPPKEKP